MFSGSTNYREKGPEGLSYESGVVNGKSTHSVQLVAQVYRVDVVAFKVGEHDNLNIMCWLAHM